MIEFNMSTPATPEPPLTRREHLRRVVRLCCDFTRNLAYYRVGLKHARTWQRSRENNFWLTATNNCLDMCVLDWCKLFGLKNDPHHWGNIASNPKEFESKLLQCLNTSAAEFEKFRLAMREYRDKFVAHLDVLRKMNIPHFDIAQKSVTFYCEYVAKNEVQVGILVDLPDSAEKLIKAYQQCESEAERAYTQQRSDRAAARQTHP